MAYEGTNSIKLLDSKSGRIMAVHQEPSKIHFQGIDNREIMRLEPNGDIYVHGKLVENDKQVVDGLRHFLLSHGYSL